MTRPYFVPGTTVVFNIKPRPGIRPVAQYLGARLAVPVAWARALAAEGRVRLDGFPANPETTVDFSRNIRLEADLPDIWPPHMGPAAMPLDILHEDGHILALAKPPGIVVHPARGHLDNATLQNGVRHHCRRLLGVPGATIGAPHRLDKDTSGVIVFALTRTAFSGLAEQFAARGPHKEYLALVDGRPDFDVASSNAPLGTDPGRNQLGAVVPEHEGGKPARTDFHVLERGRDWGLLRAVPHTGRAHQIRLHLAHMGLPIAGDRDYNPRASGSGIGRQALHAAALSITHPATGERLRFAAPTPPDLEAAIARARARG